MPNWIWFVCAVTTLLSFFSSYLAWRYASGGTLPRWLERPITRRRLFVELPPRRADVLKFPPESAIRRGRKVGQLID